LNSVINDVATSDRPDIIPMPVAAETTVHRLPAVSTARYDTVSVEASSTKAKLIHREDISRAPAYDVFLSLLERETKGATGSFSSILFLPSEGNEVLSPERELPERGGTERSSDRTSRKLARSPGGG
jgi:hypothetical protein